MNLRELTDDLLIYWFALARLRDEEGLPIDLMYYHLAQKDALPRVIENQRWRAATEEEFIQGVTDCVAIRQGRAPEPRNGKEITQDQVQALRDLYVT